MAVSEWPAQVEGNHRINSGRRVWTQSSSVCAAKSLVYAVRLEYSPAAALPKTLPDREFSDKSRKISDIGRINLGLCKNDMFPIRWPEI